MCEIEGCENKAHSRGWCMKHYLRNYHHGSPYYERPKPTPKVKVKKVRKTGGTHKEVVGYKGRHDRLRLRYGRASENDCSICFEKADAWAFIREWCPDDEVLREEKDFPNGRRRVVEYSLDDAHYLTLCKSDHAKLDAGISPSWELSNE